MSVEKPLISLDDITVRLGEKKIFPGTTWHIARGEHWAVLGPNGAGKSSLAKALAGELPVVGGRVRRKPVKGPFSVGYVSFELHQDLIAREEALDAARDFSGKIDSYTLVRDILFPAGGESEPALARIVERLEIGPLLDRGIRFLSNGEMRKVLIARALMKSPSLLILDEPFDGLDDRSRRRLAESLDRLMNGHTQIVLVTHRFEEIPCGITDVIGIRDCRVLFKGKREEMMTEPRLLSLYGEKRTEASGEAGHGFGTEAACASSGEVLIDMRNITVRYGDLLVIDRLSWKMRRGENWGIVGPNGAGKSTLLHLITGDNPQAYANEIYLFGRRRGTGESVSEIKSRIGIVSPELQVGYRRSIKAGEVVLSGFFDSIGLYRKPTPRQREEAARWIDRLGISDKAGKRFDRLSSGEKRMVLIARAMVKSPDLLVLDEPCQGLDRENRRMVLDLLSRIGTGTGTGLLMVTHHEEEILPCITRLLRLSPPGLSVPTREIAHEIDE